MHARLAVVIGIVSVVGCGGPGDPAAPDAGTAAAFDAMAALPADGFGALRGDCDVLDDELTAAAPAYFDSAIEFERMYTDADLDRLTVGGQEIVADGNAGGSSLLSEVFAYELLARCERASLLKTETEIRYDTDGTITGCSSPTAPTTSSTDIAGATGRGNSPRGPRGA
jgi:hypothetical protein